MTTKALNPNDARTAFTKIARILDKLTEEAQERVLDALAAMRPPKSER